MENGFVDVKDLTARYGLKESWWYAKAEAGEIPSLKLGKYRKFRLSEVEAWIEAQRQKPTKK
jgi:excisionase family DNA binding protein